MTPTPESIAALRQSSEILAYLCDRAEIAGKLESENETLRRLNADASRLASQEATAKHYAEEHLTHLAKFLGLPGMTWSHVVSEAVSLIERQNREADRLRSMLDTCQASNRSHLQQVQRLTAERDAAGGETLATLEAEFIAIQELKEDRRKLRAAIDKSREALGNAMPECRSMSIQELVIEAGARIQQLAEARAENGRQAATIASLMTAPEPCQQSLRERIRSAINCTSSEGGSDTPDFILADYLMAALDAFDAAVRVREEWYGRATQPATIKDDPH